MTGKRNRVTDARQLRNLKQYKDLTDEEFEELYTDKALNLHPSMEFEKRIERKIKEFEKDYDLGDLKINDRETLRALTQAIISLEDYEQGLYKMRGSEDGISQENVYLFEKLSKVMSDLRSDISLLQTDLKITRKIRKSDQETSFVTYLEHLKEQARKFYESRMLYIFCPKCKTLLGTIWCLYPEEKKNKVKLICNRSLTNGIVCDGEITIGTKELIEKKGYSNPELIPERML
jgi:hypothetical protein